MRNSLVFVSSLHGDCMFTPVFNTLLSLYLTCCYCWVHILKPSHLALTLINVNSLWILNVPCVICIVWQCDTAFISATQGIVSINPGLAWLFCTHTYRPFIPHWPCSFVVGGILVLSWYDRLTDHRSCPASHPSLYYTVVLWCYALCSSHNDFSVHFGGCLSDVLMVILYG